MISFNKKILIALCVLCNLVVSAQDTHYYKLTKKVVNGTASTNVSGGQFITFIGEVCYESNNKGVGVDNGKLTRNKNYSTYQYTVYQGTCFYGSNSEFKFNSDKSVLNIITEKGDIYVYKKATPPQGVTTCSLIKKAQNKASSPTRPSSGPMQKWVPCPACHNSGQCHCCFGTGKNTNGNPCIICGGSGRCTTCAGQGGHYEIVYY